MGFIQSSDCEPLYRSRQLFADFQKYFRVVEVRGGFDDGAGALFGFYGVGEGGGVFHEDAAAYEDGFGAAYVPARVAAGLWAGIVAAGLLKCFASRESVSSSPINP